MKGRAASSRAAPSDAPPEAAAPAGPPLMVRRPAELKDLCDRLKSAGRFVFDTEFVSEDSYRRQVCLIQVATSEFCALIDPLPSRGGDGLDTAPFWALVTDAKIETILHAGNEDVGICLQETGRRPGRLFDLQIAAGFIGWGYPISLARLVKATTNQRLHKSQTLSDWRRRPLSTEQIHYAVEDVAHLPAAYTVICEKLSKLGRLEWAREECRAGADETAASAANGNDGELPVRKLRGVGGLSRRELAIAEALSDERERLAQELDRPVRGVMKDHLLVELARHGWTDVKRMRTLRGINVSDAALRRLAAAIERARELPESQLPEIQTNEESPELDMLVSLTSAVLRDFASQSGIAYGLLSPGKRDLRSFVAGFVEPGRANEPSVLARGWRQAAIGKTLEELISGQRRIRVMGGKGPYRLALE